MVHKALALSRYLTSTPGSRPCLLQLAYQSATQGDAPEVIALQEAAGNYPSGQEIFMPQVSNLSVSEFQHPSGKENGSCRHSATLACPGNFSEGLWQQLHPSTGACCGASLWSFADLGGHATLWREPAGHEGHGMSLTGCIMAHPAPESRRVLVMLGVELEVAVLGRKVWGCLALAFRRSAAPKRRARIALRTTASSSIVPRLPPLCVQELPPVQSLQTHHPVQQTRG
ncbi:uncharacterized protein LOC134508687 [Chroicocephalus ridibundus]|uniref:uncharacterized protein LOC134508687 n=1 Tax=Chroicocephalus ridibundus TaxID=1192867 RepID=UPI002FDD35A6